MDVSFIYAYIESVAADHFSALSLLWSCNLAINLVLPLFHICIFTLSLFVFSFRLKLLAERKTKK